MIRAETNESFVFRVLCVTPDACVCGFHLVEIFLLLHLDIRVQTTYNT